MNDVTHTPEREQDAQKPCDVRIVRRIIKARRKWLRENSIQDWNDDDTIRVVETYIHLAAKNNKG